MAMRQVLLIWALLLLSLASASPIHSVNGTFGGSAHFDVFIPIPTNFRVVWIFGEIGHVTVVAEICDGESPAYNPRYRGRSQLFGNGTLRLDNVTYADAGHYTLYVYDDHVFSTNIVPYGFKIFVVLQAPSLSIVSDLIVHGTNLTLHCDAGSQTVTTYTFYRGQKMICSEPHVTCRGSFLDLTPKSKGDSGSYTCRIENPVSSNTSHPIPVTVSVPFSAVTLTTNSSDLLLWPGRDSVSLQCSSNGRDVSYSWTLDGAPLPQDPRYQLTLNSSALNISPVSTTDNGYFMCTARNSTNQENSTRLYLNLAGGPEATSLEYIESTDPTRIVRVKQNQTLLIKIWQSVHMSISYPDDQHPGDDILDKQ